MKNHVGLLVGTSLCAAFLLGMPAAALAEESAEENGELTQESDQITLADTEQGVTVYRMYLVDTDEHLYTSDYNEVVTLYNNYGWGYEGEAWTSPTSGTPVYRVYNAGLSQHLYSSDKNELDTLTTQYGWVYDNNAQPLFYSSGSINVYRMYKDPLHLLTTDFNEYSVLPSYGWGQEGIAMQCLALPSYHVAKTRWSPESMTDGFVSGSDGRTYYYVNGEMQRNTMVHGYRTRGVDAYYWVGADGALVTGRFIQASECGYLCYAESDGAILPNRYFEKDGTWWHADGNGALTQTSEAYARAAEIAASCGNDLYTCFTWCSSISYDSSLGSRDFYDYDEDEWLDTEALRFYNGGGDCYSYAAGFCVLARVLGYEAHAICGYVPAAAGGMISHGWVEVTINGQTLVYDPESANEHPEYNWYAQTYDSSAMAYTK